MESILKFFKKDKEKKSLKTVLLKKTGSDENLIFKENLLDKLPLPLILIDSKRNIITFNETASFKFSLKKNTNLLYCIRIPSFREKIQQHLRVVIGENH